MEKVDDAPPPAPREPGFESCSRRCTCPGAMLCLLSLPLGGSWLQGGLSKSGEDLTLSTVLTPAEAGEGWPGWRGTAGGGYCPDKSFQIGRAHV